MPKQDALALSQLSEHDRLVRELSRANRRLSGTLNIILATLDAPDVTTLFTRVITEITNTFEASGTLFYTTQERGLRLQGVSSSLEKRISKTYLPSPQAVEQLAIKAGNTLRLQTTAPKNEELRTGHLSTCMVIDEETGKRHAVTHDGFPPFRSFLCIPIWFGGRVIAVFDVGWESQHPTKKDDADLMDAVAQYLSVQLMGAFSTLKTQREQRLKESLLKVSELFSQVDTKANAGERIDTKPGITAGHISQVQELYQAQYQAFCEVAAAVQATCYPAQIIKKKDHKMVVRFINGTAAAGEVLLDEDELTKLDNGVLMASITQGSVVSRSLASLGFIWQGLVFDMQEVCTELKNQEDVPQSAVLNAQRQTALYEEAAHTQKLQRATLEAAEVFFVVRTFDQEPFAATELSFMQNAATQIAHFLQDNTRSRQAEHIAQALQTGMENKLQKVPGLLAAGVYSSATQSATIGGDFYDLIRLPSSRACVIMGDVSGKGVEAASVSAAVKTALGAYAWQGILPAEMVRLLNEFLLGFSRIETFATLFVGLIDVKDKTLTYCSAGHPPALLVRAKDSEIELLDVQSGVVGAFHDITYKNGQVHLEAGDKLLLYTDGTTEARAQNGAFFGDEGLHDAVVRTQGLAFDEILPHILHELDEFTSNTLKDDVALVCVSLES